MLTKISFKNRDDKLVTIKIGDWVGFKSDYEQSGQVTKITQSSLFANYMLTVENENGFGGEYLRYATVANVAARDVWLDLTDADSIG